MANVSGYQPLFGGVDSYAPIEYNKTRHDVTQLMSREDAAIDGAKSVALCGAATTAADEAMLEEVYDGDERMTFVADASGNGGGAF